MKNLLLLFSLLSFTILSSCYYDVEEELYPNTCNTSGVTFSGTVNPLLTSYGCLGCHSGSGAQGNVNLEGYNNVKAKVADGKLWGAINHQPGFSAMPQGSAKMSSCDISKIKAWIDSGIPNN